MKKRVITLFLAATMAFGLAACGGGGDNVADNVQSDNGSSADDGDQAAGTPQAAGGKVLSVQVGSDPETIDPALNSAVDGGNMILHAFEGLLTLDEGGNLAEGQAESWETDEEGLTWTFHLRDGLKWSDGTDLTANDFVYSWKRVCDPEVAAPYAETVLGMVEGYADAVEGNLDALKVEAPDDKTFVVKLTSPCPYFGSLAAFATLSPVQQGTIDTNGDAWAIDAGTYICNGPFYISEWRPGAYIMMSKNPNYWNADAIKLDAIKWNLIEDPNASYSAYQTEEIMMIKDVPTEEIPSLSGSDEFYIDPIIGTYYLRLNTQKEPFNDVNVRKALSLAIDRDYVANTLMQGTYTPAYNFIGPGWLDTDGTEFISKANGGQPYISSDHDANIEEAKKLLSDAGYPDGQGLPTITYSTNDASYHKVVAEYLQQAWAEIGVDCQVDIVEWASFTPIRRNGDFDSSRNGWVGDYSDASNMLDLFYSSNGNNDGKFSSPDYDAAMDISRTTLDAAERSEALHKAEDVLLEEMGCIPLAYYNDFWLQRKELKGSWHGTNGYWYFMYADIDDGTGSAEDEAPTEVEPEASSESLEPTTEILEDTTEQQ